MTTTPPIKAEAKDLNFFYGGFLFGSWHMFTSFP